MATTDTISEARRQLLEKLRRGQMPASSGAPERLVPLPLGGEAPLSPDLEQLWFRDRMSGAAPINNESFTIHKRGPLDPAILELCFNEIARRHEIWRSAFLEIDGQVVQHVDAHVRVSLPLTDLSHLAADQREAESQRIGTEDARRPFDVGQAPLFRAHLVRWAPDYHRVYLTVHRLAFDCMSIEHVLIGELAALYRAYFDGLPSPLPELAFQYSDYAAWKQRASANGSDAAQMEYWRKNLAGDLRPIELPADRPRPAQPTWRSEMEICLIPAQLMEALQQLSRSEGATPYMILLAVFQVLLYRYSGQNEIVVGGKTNTRTRPEFEPLIGSFVNTVVFRSPIEAELSFREFLGRVKGDVLGALAHSDVPFDDIVRELAPRPDAGRHPLFQILFSIRAPFGAFPQDWDLTDMEVDSGASGFDLFVEFAEHPKGMAGRFVYSADLFDRSTIQRWQRDFQTLLQELVSDPAPSVSQAPLSAAQEGAKPLEQKAELTKISATAAPREFVPAQDQIEARLTAVWQELLSVHPIGVTENYFDLGGTSVLALRLFAEIKFCFDLDLPLATLFYAPTVRTLAGVIRDSGVQAASPIVPIQPHGGKPPIFCIGPVNGEVILYRHMALELGPQQPVYGLQPFSLLDRVTTIERLAAGYIEQLEQNGERQPFCLLGYSFGGLVAVEMAQQLRKRGVQPALVALVDTDYVPGCKAWNAGRTACGAIAIWRTSCCADR